KRSEATGRLRRIRRRPGSPGPPDVLLMISSPEAVRADRPARFRTDRAGLVESRRWTGTTALTRKGFPTQWQTTIGIAARPKDKPAERRKCRSLAEIRPESDIRRPSEPGEDDEREH